MKKNEKTFEDRLARLEQLSASIRQNDITLEEALSCFEEGIKLAKNMEKELDKIEGKIQILMTNGEIPAEIPDKRPELDLFTGIDM